MSVIEVVILAIVEGITEFLPVSSTGHMIIASSIMGIADDDFVKMFTVGIQFGAILSVIVLYFKRFFQSVDFYLKLFIAFLPAAVVGFLLGDYIDQLLGNVIVVAVSLIAGGVILLFVDDWFKKNEIEIPFSDSRIPDGQQSSAKKEIEMNYTKAFRIGVFQIISMVPGVSRSAATIIGGLTQKLNRKNAAEFSFFLAVPTMFAATVYKIYSYNKETGLSKNDLDLFLIGNAVAFVVAVLAIKGFISFLTRNGFRIFGWYRIALGVLILILLACRIDLKVV